MNRKECLTGAEKCVTGQRKQNYGEVENNFSAIGLFWSVYLRNAHPELNMAINTIDAKDVAAMMALLKIARIASPTATEDSFVDLAGYAACGCEIATEKK